MKWRKIHYVFLLFCWSICCLNWSLMLFSSMKTATKTKISLIFRFFLNIFSQTIPSTTLVLTKQECSITFLQFFLIFFLFEPEFKNFVFQKFFKNFWWHKLLCKITQQIRFHTLELFLSTEQLYEVTEATVLKRYNQKSVKREDDYFRKKNYTKTVFQTKFVVREPNKSKCLCLAECSLWKSLPVKIGN